MGIYISGVKGLPEQVQANKEDITTIKEEIAGIDFDAIRQLEAQVAENTQDINNLEASIGVQNQAINSLNDDVDALESKTQLMSYNDDYGQTEFRNSIEVADDVVATGIHVAGDGVMINSNGSGLHFQEGADDDVLTIANKDGAVSHYLQLHADGTLTLDGAPVGGKALYMHNIACHRNVVNQNIFFSATLMTDSPTAFTKSTLGPYLNTNNLIAINACLNATGSFDNGTNKYIIGGLVYSAVLGGLALVVCDTTQTTLEASMAQIPVNAQINDNVIQIA